MQVINVNNSPVLYMVCGSVRTHMSAYSILQRGSKEAATSRIVKGFSTVKRENLTTEELQVIQSAVNDVFDNYVLEKETSIVITLENSI